MNRFLTPKKTLIVAHGAEPSRALFEYCASYAHLVIALDGASRYMTRENLRFDLVIGDMDSAHLPSLSPEQMVITPDQNSNDLEKSLRYCQSKELQEVTVLGAFGMRSDHFLTNLHVISKFSEHMTITLLSDNELACMCPKNQELVIDHALGSYLSLFPLSDVVKSITTTGVEYPLVNEDLSIASRLGTLNRINASRATISYESGQLLILMPYAVPTPYLS